MSIIEGQTPKRKVKESSPKTSHPPKLRHSIKVVRLISKKENINYVNIYDGILETDRIPVYLKVTEISTFLTL